MPITIACIAGARPNFMKIAPLMAEFRRRPALQPKLIHTGQHFSPEMSERFFRDLHIPEPDLNLGAGSGTHTEQTAEIMRRLEPVFSEARPDVVLVVGDVNSTVAAALVAAKMGIPVAHVEAGLRSFDRRMPEEINRLVTDVLSDYLFVSEPSGLANLAAEGIPREKVHFVGNVMIDTLFRCRDVARRSDVLARLGIEPAGYALATLHRPSNVDEPPRLAELLSALSELSHTLPVVLPLHPRTEKKMRENGLDSNGILLTPPLGYLDFLRLMDGARLVLTDSGGIQEETTVLGVPCLTLRENTERPVTIEQGSNRLVTGGRNEILSHACEALDEDRRPRLPQLWDGKASVRIADILERQS